MNSLNFLSILILSERKPKLSLKSSCIFRFVKYMNYPHFFILLLLKTVVELTKYSNCTVLFSGGVGLRT